MTMNDPSHDETIARIKRERLQVLKEQQAFFGRDTRPHITNEIRELEKDLGIAPDPPAIPAGEADGAGPAAAPKPTPPPAPDDPLRRLIAWLQARYLTAYEVAWLISSLVLVAAAAQAFSPDRCWLVAAYALLTLAGTAALQVYGLLPSYRSRYPWWDRLLAALIGLVLFVVLGFLISQGCIYPFPAAS